ncbi:MULTISPECIES: hypothetical protein [unclassified Imperialibacter]|uniref:hypothetical protein n=1 Tax=unclassified Imperialibacter TaxID=2629706 RepID=UPI0012541F03|nr:MULTISPECIES: hypothetical protein [unclassified Imperialibacter]CAD5255109.1 conserved hypothetical protein [Imperialibacter sp. 89]CAD5256452.1 conserved hypothetical protein [Imperialibacter sp. 75]VVT20213.1 conserved hypothetical protein [Imperialibacter sp. EC-SDR9]
MTIAVEITKINETDNHEGTVTFEVNGRQYDAFYSEDKFKLREKINVTLTHLDYPLKWDVIFGGNKGREIRIEKSNQGEWTYHCYGTIKSVNPIIGDFGDFQFNLGDWTSDEKVIGEYIFWTIDRLELKRAE